MQGSPATSALSMSSVAAKDTYKAAVKAKTGVVIGHSKVDKIKRSAHRAKMSPSPKKKSPKKSPKAKSPKGMNKDGSPRKPNAWHEHLKKYRRKNNVAGMSVAEVSKAARETYTHNKK